MNESDRLIPRRQTGNIEFVAVSIFILINLAAPLIFGDLYPFTIAPMFSDKPGAYCNYYVYDPAGRQLLAAHFQLQREYDGNPPGLGAGIKPPTTFDRFGSVPDGEELTAHLTRQFGGKSGLKYVDVVQEVIGPISHDRVGVVRVNRWRVHP